VEVERAMTIADIEKVGVAFEVEGMLALRRATRSAIDHIARAIRPGMTEEEAVSLAKRSLRELGLPRVWHQTFVRLGENTVLEYGRASRPGVVLAENDIFFVDIGPVAGRLEGDGGATFVVGDDVEMARGARDVVDLWHRTHDVWRNDGLTGRELYRFAACEARRLGWELNLKRMSGHRIGDFPHPLRYEGLLSDADLCPSPLLWVLEMHIRHPLRAFGAFYEDLLLPVEA